MTFASSLIVLKKYEVFTMRFSIHFLSILVSSFVLCMHCSGEIHLTFECMAFDHILSDVRQWKGIIIDDIKMNHPENGQIKFIFAYPYTWSSDRCCNNLHLKFDSDDIIDAATHNRYFIPNLEWTICQKDLRHYKCHAFLDNPHYKGTHIKDAHLWLNFLLCNNPENNTIDYDLDIYGLGNLINVEQKVYKGSHNVVHLSGLKSEHITNPGERPCFFTGNIPVKNHWFEYLFNASIAMGSGIFYKITYHVNEPSNDAFLSLYFHPMDSSLPQTDDTYTCRQFQSNLLQHPEGTFEEIPLSLNNIWSGCKVKDIKGVPTYICEGGRVFTKSESLNIVLSGCNKQLKASEIHYFLVVADYIGECQSSNRIESPLFLVSSLAPTVHVNKLNIVILGNLIFVFIFLKT